MDCMDLAVVADIFGTNTGILRPLISTLIPDRVSPSARKAIIGDLFPSLQHVGPAPLVEGALGRFNRITWYPLELYR